MRAAGDPDLKIYGIFGYPLSHTVSPAMQESAFDHYRLKALYFSFERNRKQFLHLMKNLRQLLLDGFNVTVPYKEEVMPFLDSIEFEARLIGAVNTVKKQDGKWMGYNTDVFGFMQGLRRVRFKCKGKSAVILGAGGSARAVAFGLAKAGIARVFIVNRTLIKAKKIVVRFKKLYPKIHWSVGRYESSGLKQMLNRADLLVNATKVGLRREDPVLFSASCFPKRKILVYDLIYRPRKTKLLKMAEKKGHVVINGETMLLYQGTRAFEIWTGRKAPISTMRKALSNALDCN